MSFKLVYLTEEGNRPKYLLKSEHFKSGLQNIEENNRNFLFSTIFSIYEGVSIKKQPIPFPMDRDGHDFHVLFQYMFYTWVQNCTRIESFFNKILNVKHG